MKKHRAARCFGFEHLEHRNLLAGNIAATTFFGSLILMGDGSANSVRVMQASPDTWRVQGIGTRVNGSLAAQTFGSAATPILNISADLLNGNDVIEVFNGALVGSLAIFTGNGADSVLVDNITSDTVIAVGAHAGNDSVTISRSHVRFGPMIVDVNEGANNVTMKTVSSSFSMSVQAGSGNDRVTIAGATENFNNIEIIAGEGTNAVNISNATTFYGVNVSSGNGRDTISLTNIRDANDLNPGLSTVTISAAGGANAVALSNVAAVSIGITTGDGTDSIKLAGAQIKTSLTITAGNGANTITGNGLNVGSNLVVSTGIHRDSVALSRVNVANDSVIETQAGTDAVNLNSTTVVGDLVVNLGAGNNDQLIIMFSAAANAAFNGGDGAGDLLVRLRNTFGTQINAGFELVI